MIRILIAGDYCPHNRVAEKYKHNNYSAIEFAREYTSQSDFSIVNLECPVDQEFVCKPIRKTGPNLRCKNDGVGALASVGFSCVTLANNHFLDYGEDGVRGTLEALKKYNLSYVGGGCNLAEASTTLYVQIKEKCVAIINCCEHEFSIADENHAGSNPLSVVKQYYAIKEASKQADYVIVIVHGGPEHYQLPTPRMQETYRFFIEVGANVVVNHHQHCYNGYEKYGNGYIFYGIGNFCFDRGKRQSPWNEGYMVMLEMADSNINTKIIPYNQCDDNPIMRAMNDKERELFNKHINQLNDTICNSDKLAEEYDKFLHKDRLKYLFFLEPYRSRVARYLYRHHLLPSFLSAEKKVIIENIVRCESHVDRLIFALKS